MAWRFMSAVLTRLTKMSSSELSAGLQVLEVDAVLAQAPQQAGDARSRSLCVSKV